jgi:hypothetical protein
LKVVLMSATLQLKDFISNRILFDVIPQLLWYLLSSFL